jgi:ABC-2 type transport system ATP-binding protein
MDGLKVREIISLFRGYYLDPLSMERLISLTGLNGEDLNKRTEKLSGGQKRSKHLLKQCCLQSF